MVARVDTVLREELNLPDGLADKNVFVLDPCCGTGSYLVEVLRKIHETLKQRGEDALIASDLKEAAKNRVFAPPNRPAASKSRRAARGKRRRTHRRLPDERPYWLGASQRTQDAATLQGT
jgi:hypothetical protein